MINCKVLYQKRIWTHTDLNLTLEWKVCTSSPYFPDQLPHYAANQPEQRKETQLLLPAAKQQQLQPELQPAGQRSQPVLQAMVHQVRVQGQVLRIRQTWAAYVGLQPNHVYSYLHMQVQ